MSCLEMYNQNSEHKPLGVGGAPPISPRISFSNDFIDSTHSSSSSSSSHSHSHKQRYRDAPVSSDFEFSVSNYSMMSADELFFKGRLLPFKETCSSSSTNSFQKSSTTTLRDELQNDDEAEDNNNSNNNNNFSLRPPKNPTRWKGFLSLRKAHVGAKKSQEDVQCSKNSQDSVE